MSVRSEFIRRDGYLLVHLTGSVDREWVRRTPQNLEERVRACREAAVGGMVLDVRETTMAIDIGDRYDLGVHYGQSEIAPLRVAILGLESQSTPDRFFQNVANNRGAKVGVFFDEAEAIAWARGQSTAHVTGSG